MMTIHDTYAVFEANQVLTAAHLNELFAYLDEHERLTRANLIGIGIACGLDMRFDSTTSTFHLSKGCGVTSEGYLIIEPTDVELSSWRKYTLPADLAYPTFDNDAAVPREPFELWELCPDGEPGTQPLSGGGLDITHLAVLLFLELKKADLRTCTANSCDDRGAAVTATVRRLLIKTEDLLTVIDKAQKSGGATPAGTDVADRLNLDDLGLPRVDVPATNPVTSEDVLLAFQQAFRKDRLAARTGEAFTAAYKAFKPLVEKAYDKDPFGDFAATFGFLDDAPRDATEVTFLQYYWDFFGDLISAYDEFRWAGIDLLCGCCPPEGLFPRHLMLGVVDTAGGANRPDRFRQRFLPSAANSGAEGRCEDVLMLFHRLVTMVKRLTNTPALAPPGKGPIDEQIRITPSVWVDDTLGAQAIPYYYYYYTQDGATPLHQVWNPEQSRRTRATQNLSYRTYEYAAAEPAFVTDPLSYELQPHDFLRIEGHLGKNVRSALSTLLTYRSRYRLPIEIIALRTGAFDERIPIDLRKEDCRFEDLEAIYATLKAELACFLCKEVRYFYDLPSRHQSAITKPQPPTLALLRDCVPDYLVRPGTLGRLIEDVPARRRPAIAAVVLGQADLIGRFASLAYSLVGSMSALSAQLSADVRHLDFDGFGERYQDLVEAADQFEQARLGAPGHAEPAAFQAVGLAERLSDILFRCRLDPFRALEAEYKRRILKARQAQFLSFFLQHHPGIQHKAGAPLGGTFILVYHEDPLPASTSTRPGRPAVPGLPGLRLPLSFNDITALRAVRPSLAATGVDDAVLARALAGLQFNPRLAGEPAIQSIYQMITGEVLVTRQPPIGARDQVYVDAVADLADGTVIADFFLPYICCSDCTPMHYTLPKDRPRLTVKLGCTDERGNAEATLTPEGTAGAVSVQVDGGPFVASNGKLLLSAGTHSVVIRDDDGAESAPTQVVVPHPLTIGIEQFTDDPATGTYQVTFEVSGGTPPYSAKPGAVAGTTYTSTDVESGKAVKVTVTDAVGCTSATTIEHAVCDLPCGGNAVLQGFRFWLPTPTRGFPLNGYRAGVQTFTIDGAPQGTIDLTGPVQDAINRAPQSIPSTEFEGIVGKWMADINELVAQEVGSSEWVHVEFAPAERGSAAGTLLIDRLDCLDVSFTLTIEFTQGRIDYYFEISYSSREVVVQRHKPAPEPPVVIPPFNVTRSNKCHPELPPIELCTDTDLRLEVRVGGSYPDEVKLSAIPSGDEAPIAYLWEVQDATPTLANAKSATFAIKPAEPTTKRVRLTAFTEKGCTATFLETRELRS